MDKVGKLVRRYLFPAVKVGLKVGIATAISRAKFKHPGATGALDDVLAELTNIIDEHL